MVWRYVIKHKQIHWGGETLFSVHLKGTLKSILCYLNLHDRSYRWWRSGKTIWVTLTIIWMYVSSPLRDAQYASHFTSTSVKLHTRAAHTRYQINPKVCITATFHVACLGMGTRELVRIARAKWSQLAKTYIDDITCVIVELHPVNPGSGSSWCMNMI